MPLTSTFLPAILDAISLGDHALAESIADLAADATIPDAGEPLAEDDAAEQARQRLRARMYRHLGGKYVGAEKPITEDRIPGGKADDRPDSDFDPEQLAKGVKVEMEHTDDPEVAKEIAKDHILYDGSIYYDALEKMEAGLQESETTDKLGRHQCYDDTSGKHVACAGNRGDGGSPVSHTASLTHEERSALESEWQKHDDWGLPGFSPYSNVAATKGSDGSLSGYVTWAVSRKGSLTFDIDTRSSERSPELARKLISTFLAKVDRSAVKRVVATAHTPEGKRLILALAKRWGVPWEGADHSGDAMKASGLAESATAVSTSDFAGQQMLQVTGKAKRSHLDEGEEEAPHKFSSTQFLLPDDLAAKILAMGKRILDADLAEDGREEEIHTTCRFGLHTDNADEARQAVEGFGPVRIRLGKTSIFSASEAGKDYDVVKVDVESDDLHRLHEALGELEHTDTHKDFRPHVTIGYVAAGKGKRYVGMDDVDGTEAVLSDLIFSDHNRNKTVIPLPDSGSGGMLENAADDLAISSVSAADEAVRVLTAILDGEQPFDAATLVDLLGRLNPEEARRVLMQVGITEEELAAASPGAILLTEEIRRDKLGREMCYDDTSGKHVPCSPHEASGKAGGESSPAPFERGATVNSLQSNPRTAAMAEAFHATPGMDTIDHEISTLAERIPVLTKFLRDPKADYATSAAASNEKAQAARKLSALREARTRASQQAFLAHHALPEDARAPRPKAEVKAGSKQAKDWEQAASFLEQITHASVGEQSVKIVSTDGRASYSSGTIKASEKDDAGVHAHEYGHHIESTSPWVKEKVQAFRKKRFRPEDDRPMAEVAPGSGYGKDEVGNPDDMVRLFGNANEAYYSGVVYGNGDTEIVSMLLEALYRHPVHLAETDPEAFALIVGLLQVERKGADNDDGEGERRSSDDMAGLVDRGEQARRGGTSRDTGGGGRRSPARGGEQHPDSTSGGQRAEVTATDIRRRTRKIADVISGSQKVGVEGRGGKDMADAKVANLYTSVYTGVPIFAKSADDAKPLEHYISGGGRYGTPEFSRLLGYAPNEIEEYKQFLIDSGQADLITHDERRGYRGGEK